MSDIVLYRRKPIIQRDGCVIRVNEEAKRVLQELKQQTGLPCSYIASEFIVQSAKNVVIVDGEKQGGEAG